MKLEIVLIGLNHKSASIDVRECLSFSKDEISNALEMLRSEKSIEEAVIFSTCNRLEVLMAANSSETAIEKVKYFLSAYKNVERNTFENTLYAYRDEEAIHHVFRVASSLDSMIVGESQILGQIKTAYKNSLERKTSGVILNRLMHRAFFVAKKVRTETGIGGSAVSISYAAVELSRKIFGDLMGKKVLLIGAGEMAELAVEHLIHNKAEEIFVANRTFERGVDLAKRYGGTAIVFEEISLILNEVDIIISSTGSPEIIISKKLVKDALRHRKNRPIFFIDIAVPRDIDPTVNQIENAYVYDIDDLKDVVKENMNDRIKESVKAERIIKEAVVQFKRWQDELSTVPTIVAMRTKLDEIARSELMKTAGSLHHLSDKDIQAISKMTHAIISKILHNPIKFLKSQGCQKDRSVPLDITRKLFNLDE